MKETDPKDKKAGTGLCPKCNGEKVIDLGTLLQGCMSCQNVWYKESGNLDSGKKKRQNP